MQIVEKCTHDFFTVKTRGNSKEGWFV